MQTQTQDLVQVKAYCVGALTQGLGPQIFAVLNNLFEVGKRTIPASQQSPWKTFQESLRDIPDWNATMISQQTTRALQDCPQLEKLVTTAMMCQATQLASVRGISLLPRDLPRVKSNQFIHDAYVRIAKELVHNPMLFGQTIPELAIQNREKVLQIIEKCLVLTIDSYIPLGTIMAKPLKMPNLTTNKSERKSEKTKGSHKKTRLLDAYVSDTFDTAQDPSFLLVDNDDGAEPMEASSGEDDSEGPLVVDVPTPSPGPQAISTMKGGNTTNTLAPTTTAQQQPIDQSFIYAPSTLGKKVTYQQAKQMLQQIIV